MARIRSDNVFGTVTGELALSDSVMTSSGLANLAVVASPDQALITLDPNRVNGAPEIVRVTSHLSGSGNAVLTRGQFGTTARIHPSGTFWVHGAVASNATSLTAQANDQGDFPPMGEWEAYTPSNTNVTVGNGTQVAKFTRLGWTIHWKYTLTFGSTTSFGSGPRIGLPVVAAGAANDANGFGFAFDVDSSPNNRPITATLIGSPLDEVRPTTSANFQITATSPFTWTMGDILTLSGTYEAAS